VFTSERQYRNRLAQLKGFKSWDAQRRAARKSVTSRAAYDALKPVEREAHARALEAVNVMRRLGLTIERAARDVGTTVESVLKFGGSSLTRGPRNRYVPKASDRLLRPMEVITSEGKQSIDVRDSRSAAKIARHANAVRHYVNTGDTSRLREFRRAVVWSGKRGHRLASDLDLDMLELHGRAGELSFEHIYQLVA
jgi:hypothetical protein